MPKIKYVAPDNAKPWERMTGESPEAYGAWLTYRDLPAHERSLSRLASDLNKNGSMIAGWSSQWGWQDRLDAWNRRLEREKESAALAAARTAGVRQAAQLEALGRVLFEPAQVLLKRMAAGEADYESFTTAELLSLSILAARAFPRLVIAERLVRGQPTDIVESVDDEGQSHIPASEAWSREFYGTLETLGLDVKALNEPVPDVEIVVDVDADPPV